ncbi:MAG: nitrilase-related carbon-nitrogen hydrolase [Sedimenticola sp.]
MDNITVRGGVPRLKRLLMSLLLVSGAAISAWLAWQGEVSLLGAALIMPGLWALAGNRWSAWSVALVYYLVAGRGIPGGAVLFFGQGEDFGWLLLLCASLALSLPYALLWRCSPQAWRIILVMLLVSIPPVGIVGWANPLTSAGVIFPGTGWYGLLGTLVLILLIVRLPVAGPVVFIISLLVPQSIPVEPAGWMAMDTQYLLPSRKRDFVADAKRQLDLVGRLQSVDGHVVVLPETIAGRWSDASMFLWEGYAEEAANRGQTVIIGAELSGESGYRNVALELTPVGGKVLYEQLMPVPVGLWRPWDESSARPAWLRRQSAKVRGLDAAFLICYEQLLIWPPLVAMSSGPEVLVGMSNDWWARGTDIPDIQVSVMKAWAALFGTSLVYAVNR